MRVLRPNEKELATAGGCERGKHRELLHKIKRGHYIGQRLAPQIGQARFNDDHGPSLYVIAA